MSALPIGWFGRDIAGRLSRTMTAGMLTLGQVIAHMLMGFIANLAALVVVVVGLWFWNTTLAGIVTIAVLVYLGGMQLVAFGQARVKQWAEPSKTELSSRVVEYARAQAALRAAGRSNSFQPLTDAVAAENRVSKKALWMESGLMMVAGTAAQLVVVVLIVTAAIMASSGALEPLPTLAFVGLSLRLMQHLSGTAELSIGLQEQGPVLASINEVLDS
ncbi:MAG: ABC transporter, partial [Micrococcales bacterium]